MSLSVVKSDFHSLIDKIQDEELLAQFYEALITYQAKNSEGAWNNLSDKEKDRVLRAFKESEAEENLIPHSKIKEKYAKWLKK